nr:MAG TPA: hypothetical protein [Caudoviricetes sp.]
MDRRHLFNPSNPLPDGPLRNANFFSKRTLSAGNINSFRHWGFKNLITHNKALSINIKDIKIIPKE